MNEALSAAVVLIVLVFAGQVISIHERRTESMSVNQLGASFASSNAPDGGDWLPIVSAPRDGSIIETKNAYGDAPTYGLFRWSDEITWPDGRTSKTSVRWTSVADSASGIGGEGSWLTWRPYRGDAATYVDPTGGKQEDPRYWRGAVAAKYGLPLDHFEK